MLSVEVAVRAIVQFTARTETDLGARLAELEGAGLRLDARYGGKGAICVNPQAGRYVARGDLPDDALPALRALGGYEIFADVKVLPASRR